MNQKSNYEYKQVVCGTVMDNRALTIESRNGWSLNTIVRREYSHSDVDYLHIFFRKRKKSFLSRIFG